MREVLALEPLGQDVTCYSHVTHLFIYFTSSRLRPQLSTIFSDTEDVHIHLLPTSYLVANFIH